MKITSRSILLILVLITSCKQEQNQQLLTETELQFSEALMTNFTKRQFLKEEEHFVSQYGKEVKRPSAIYEELAYALYKQENYNASIIVFERGAELYTNNEDCVSSLAVLHEKNNNKSAAIKNLNRAISIAISKESGGEAYYKAEIRRLKRRKAKPGVDIMFEEDD